MVVGTDGDVCMLEGGRLEGKGYICQVASEAAGWSRRALDTGLKSGLNASCIAVTSGDF